ncbi:hypothetical protein SDJN02_04576, partial [Cucurbita argyrosperma subsp. argyrosperma]
MSDIKPREILNLEIFTTFTQDRLQLHPPSNRTLFDIDTLEIHFPWIAGIKFVWQQNVSINDRKKQRRNYEQNANILPFGASTRGCELSTCDPLGNKAFSTSSIQRLTTFKLTVVASLQ